MLKAIEDISSTKKRLTIEVPAEVLEAEIKKELTNIQKKAKLPGFRPGRAPIHLIEKRFGKEVEADVLEKIIPQHYHMALKEADITPVSNPHIEGSFDFKRNEPITITVNVEVLPKIENLKYEGINVKEIPVEVKDEEIENILKRLSEEKANYESTDEPVNTGDLITFDYQDKESGMSDSDMVLKIGSGNYPEEFFNGFIGKRINQQFQIEAEFPEDSPTQFAGKRVKLDITIKDIKRRNIPPIDDEFAKDLGFENLEKLRERIKNNLDSVKKKESDRAKQIDILNQILESHTFDLPEGLVNAEIQGALAEIRAYKKDERSDESIIEEIKPIAEKNVKTTILLSLIGKKENIQVTEEDIKEEILNLAIRFNTTPDNVVKYYKEKEGAIDILRKNIFERKVLEFLLSKANVVNN